MPDVEAMVRLSSTLVGLYPGLTDARVLAEKAGLNVGNVDLSGPPRVFVWNVVSEARRVDRLDALIRAALDDYPDQPNLLQAQNDAYDQLTSAMSEPPLPDDRWRPRLSLPRAEKLMSSMSTFLPVSFLTLGAERSRSVARVMLPDLTTGTGFLVADDLLVTNHHVLPDVDAARAARVQFNVQESATGHPEQVEEYALDPESAFTTSPMAGGHDFTVVRVSGAPTRRWGSLPLSSSGVDVGSRVMIVQHPEGGFKKVALHNNLVTYVDDDVVQYMTDTLPGSSGSPVFDSTWRVVGLHHAGGDLVEPRSGTRVFRNEGIVIARVAQALERLALP